MKFSRKMILCVTFLLAMALSISGYVMVRRTMDVRLAQETADSQRDMQMFGVMLQSLTDSSLSFQTESVAQAASWAIPRRTTRNSACTAISRALARNSRSTQGNLTCRCVRGWQRS